jgi:hypothetical protein
MRGYPLGDEEDVNLWRSSIAATGEAFLRAFTSVRFNDQLRSHASS